MSNLNTNELKQRLQLITALDSAHEMSTFEITNLDSVLRYFSSIFWYATSDCEVASKILHNIPNWYKKM